MHETRATARLPRLDVEIRHGASPAGDAEYLSLSIRATPSFAAVDDHARAALGFMPWLAWNPAFWWFNAGPALMRPWLRAAASSALSIAPPGAADDRDDAPASNVLHLTKPRSRS